MIIVKYPSANIGIRDVHRIIPINFQFIAITFMNGCKLIFKCIDTDFGHSTIVSDG